jgi:hypothetical protein
MKRGSSKIFENFKKMSYEKLSKIGWDFVKKSMRKFQKNRSRKIEKMKKFWCRIFENFKKSLGSRIENFFEILKGQFWKFYHWGYQKIFSKIANLLSRKSRKLDVRKKHDFSMITRTPKNIKKWSRRNFAFFRKINRGS